MLLSFSSVIYMATDSKSSDDLRQAQFMQNYDAKGEKAKPNFEMAVIQEGKLAYQEALKMQPNSSLLCVTFTNATKFESFPVASNILKMGKMCEWAIVIYDGSENDVNKLCSDVAIKPFIVLCQRSVDSFKRNISTPKSVLYHDLLPVLPRYKKVFLMDEDISLQSFDLTKLMETWACAFRREPLIVQPVVRKGRQAYQYFNENKWKEKNWADAVAAEVGYIEQQITLMDARFFHWYVKSVLTMTKPYSIMYGVDWGHDRSWCSASKMYATHVLNVTKSYSSCAIITEADTSVVHLDLKTMEILRHPDRIVVEWRVKKILKAYKRYFPTWITLSSVNMKRAPDYNPLVMWDDYKNATHFGKYGPPMNKKLEIATKKRYCSASLLVT